MSARARKPAITTLKPLTTARHERYVLRLYVAGAKSLSRRAIVNLTGFAMGICREGSICKSSTFIRSQRWPGRNRSLLPLL